MPAAFTNQSAAPLRATAILGPARLAGHILRLYDRHPLPRCQDGLGEAAFHPHQLRSSTLLAVPTTQRSLVRCLKPQLKRNGFRHGLTVIQMLYTFGKVRPTPSRTNLGRSA